MVPGSADQCAHPRVPAGCRRAVPLVELLVVIAIIAILASMLLPAVGLVRTSARAAKCQSNLHQIHVGVMAYANDSDGALPRILYSFPNSPPHSGEWDSGSWGEDWGQAVAVFMDVRLGGYPRTANTMEGPSFSGNRATLGVFNCPENASQTWQMATAGGEAYSSYTGNGKGDYSENFGTPWGARFFNARLGQYVHSADLMAFWDGAYYASDPQQADGGGSVPYRGIGAGWVRYAHRGKANIAYADGHVGTSSLIMDCGATTAVPISTPMRAASWSNGLPWWGAD
jgi:prepilin-type processing-associated H-X9-DG protein